LIVSLVIGALMMAAAIGSAAHTWLGWFALVPLFFVIRLWRPKSALLGGALWGVSLYVFSSAQPDAAVSSTVGSLLLIAAIPATYASAGAWLTRRIGFNPFILGFAWMGVELALGPVVARTGLLGTVQGDSTILHWIGGALGYVLVAFVIAAGSASLVSVLSAARLSIPQLRYPTYSADHGAYPASPSLFWFSRFSIRPCQPRAPPIGRGFLSTP
jgi:apolipoprotein N-acyltransferase